MFLFLFFLCFTVYITKCTFNYNLCFFLVSNSHLVSVLWSHCYRIGHLHSHPYDCSSYIQKKWEINSCLCIANHVVFWLFSNLAHRVISSTHHIGRRGYNCKIATHYSCSMSHWRPIIQQNDFPVFIFYVWWSYYPTCPSKAFYFQAF